METQEPGIGDGLDPRLKLFTWDLRACANFERATGRPVAKLQVESNIDFSALLWAGIHSMDKSLTEDEIAALVTPKNYMAVLQFVRMRMEGEEAKNEEPLPIG